MQVNKNISVQNAEIGFRNFSGAAKKFNVEGQRNFSVFFSNETGEALAQDGWPIRWLKPKEEDDLPLAHLPVKVQFSDDPKRNPKIVIVTKRGKTLLDESTASILDWVEIAKDPETKAPLVDIIIRPYNWEVSGKSGVKAYLKTIYITIVEDEIESKYYDVPDSAKSAIAGIDVD